MSSGTAVAATGPGLSAEAAAVHAWRVSQLTRLGLDEPAAELVADKVDWHEVARLVNRGCAAALALMIVQ
jgi:hypothetical protein